jgi:hypothetical protein
MLVNKRQIMERNCRLLVISKQLTSKYLKSDDLEAKA